MAKVRNEPIGEVECPTKGCAELCKVYRFRRRSDDDKFARFAGKLYAECPKHGRIGGDGNAATQEYLLEHAKLWAPNDRPAAAPVAAPKPAPGPVSASTRQTPPAKPLAAPKPPAAPQHDPKRKAPWWMPIIGS